MGSDCGRAVLLVAGVLAGGQVQTVFFARAIVVDWGGIYLTSREGNWRIHSASHWTERHGLFVILAIGESIVAIEAGAPTSRSARHCSSRPCSASRRPCATGGCTSTWSPVLRNTGFGTRGAGRFRMVIEAYSYGHFPIVAGIVVSALGVEGVLAHAGGGEPLDMFYAVALYGGSRSTSPGA
jgi:low temperature requirement protein LtrA